MSTLNPSEADVLKWLGVVASPESVEARQMGAGLIITAFRQGEEANRILAAEVVRLRTQNDEQVRLLQRCEALMKELFPPKPAPALRVIRPEVQP